jgi:uncharacterized protein
MIGVVGSLHTPETIGAEQKGFVGCAFVFEADNIEEVWNAIKSDIFYTGGVVSVSPRIMEYS